MPSGIPTTMTKVSNTTSTLRTPTIGGSAVVSALLALVVSCGDASTPVVPPFNGSGGSGANAGTGGMTGTWRNRWRRRAVRYRWNIEHGRLHRDRRCGTGGNGGGRVRHQRALPHVS